MNESKLLRKYLFSIVVLIAISLSCGIIPQETTSLSPASTSPPKKQPSITPTQADENPTDEPQATETEESPPATETPASSALVAAPPSDGGQCANVLFPFIEGNQWIYQVTSDSEEYQVSLTVSDVKGNEAILNTLYVESGLTTETTVVCDNGAIINYPVAMLAFLFGDVDGSFELQHIDGVYSPAYDTFQESDWDLSWEGNYKATGEIVAEIDGDTITGRLEESPLKLNWHTAGTGEAIFEEIEVLSGIYPNAIRISRDINLDFTAQLEEDGAIESLSAVLELTNNLWFEPNMGLLKQEIDEANIKLYGVRFPIVFESTVELVEFRQGE